MLALPERSLEISNPPDCLRQLIFESDWEEFPYWMMGTSFLALWNNSIFLITAAHETPGDARDLDVSGQTPNRARPL
jgi:hypothetical protein